MKMIQLIATGFLVLILSGCGSESDSNGYTGTLPEIFKGTWLFKEDGNTIATMKDGKTTSDVLDMKFDFQGQKILSDGTTAEKFVWTATITSEEGARTDSVKKMAKIIRGELCFSVPDGDDVPTDKRMQLDDEGYPFEMFNREENPQRENEMMCFVRP